MNQRMVWILIFILSTLYFPTASFAKDEIRIGSVAMDTPAVMHKRLRPLTQYLSDALQRPVTLKLSPDMSSAITDVATGRVDLAYLTPVAYIRSHQKGNTQIVAKTVTNKRASFQLMIVVGEDSQIKTVADLKGKKFAFGDRAALLQRATVVGANMPLESLGSYDFLGHYDNIVRAILHGDYDAGILKDTKALKWQGKGIRIIYESPHLPPYNLTASSKLDSSTFKKIQNALLNLDSSNPAHKRIIKSLSKKYDGFAKTSDSEYDVIRKLVAPFSNK